MPHKIEIPIRSLSVYSSPWKTRSMFSNSSWRFLARSFSFFLLRLIHFRVSSTSPSASPKVAPLSFALSSRLFLTLIHRMMTRRELWCSYRPTGQGNGRSDWQGKRSDQSTYFAMRSWICLWRNVWVRATRKVRAERPHTSFLALWSPYSSGSGNCPPLASPCHLSGLCRRWEVLNPKIYGSCLSPPSWYFPPLTYWKGVKRGYWGWKGRWANASDAWSSCERDVRHILYSESKTHVGTILSDIVGVVSELVWWGCGFTSLLRSYPRKREACEAFTRRLRRVYANLHEIKTTPRLFVCPSSHCFPVTSTSRIYYVLMSDVKFIIIDQTSLKSIPPRMTLQEWAPKLYHLGRVQSVSFSLFRYLNIFRKAFFTMYSHFDESKGMWFKSTLDYTWADCDSSCAL